MVAAAYILMRRRNCLILQRIIQTERTHIGKRMRLAGVVLILGLLQGCFGAPSIDDTMDEYTTRLSRVLDKPLVDEHSPSTQPLNPALALPSQTYPSLIELGNNVTALNINIREFYAIQDCELGRIVAERNTALGKTQLPSQRLGYEHRVLKALANCETTLQGAQDPIAATVANWREQKQAQYQSVWANVVQTSTEMRLGLSMAASPLQASENKDANASINALNFINGLAGTSILKEAVEVQLEAKRKADGNSSGDSGINGDSGIDGDAGVADYDSRELEQQLQIIASSRLPAKLWQTQAILHNRLVVLNQALAPALNDVHCENGVTSDKATILRNVFYLYFIEEIQPIASTLNSYHYQLQPLWKQWSENTALSAPFKAHIYTHAVENFTLYSDAMKAHVVLWQDFLGRCNLSPTAP